MIYGLYNSAAGMMTNEYRQSVIANNLANADTTGFKQEIAVFAERQTESIGGRRQGPSSPEMENLSGGLWLGHTHTDYHQGSLIQTGKSTDIALDGPGFLVVEVDGRPQYTRDGRLFMDESGHLRSVTDGAAVLSPGGAQILLNPRGSQPTIDRDGRLWQDGGIRGRLAVVDFEDYRGLRKAGSGRFDAGDVDTIESPARVLSEKLERSGVEPVKELVNMIETSRAYEINARMLSLQDQSVGRLISTLAR